MNIWKEKKYANTYQIHVETALSHLLLLITRTRKKKFKKNFFYYFVCRVGIDITVKKWRHSITHLCSYSAPATYQVCIIYDEILRYIFFLSFHILPVLPNSPIFFFVYLGLSLYGMYAFAYYTFEVVRIFRWEFGFFISFMPPFLLCCATPVEHLLLPKNILSENLIASHLWRGSTNVPTPTRMINFHFRRRFLFYTFLFYRKIPTKYVRDSNVSMDSTNGCCRCPVHVHLYTLYCTLYKYINATSHMNPF